MILAPRTTDCIIVGGGPAGLTAVLYLARFLRSVRVIDARQGRARTIPMTHNLGAFPSGISGGDLLDRMQAQAGHYGAVITSGTVLSVEADGDGFRVTTNRNMEMARSVIFATGVFNHRPPLSVEDHDAGLARGLVRYCPVCDAFEVRGRRIAVLGTGDHGFAEARFVRRYASSVTLIAPDGAQAVARDGIGVPDAPISGIALADREVIITLEDGQSSHFDTLYVALGTTPNSGLAAALGVRLEQGGFVGIDDRQQTSMDRVYAVGDVTEGLDQISVAMGQAAIAATAVHNALQEG